MVVSTTDSRKKKTYHETPAEISARANRARNQTVGERIVEDVTNWVSDVTGNTPSGRKRRSDLGGHHNYPKHRLPK